MPDPVPEANEMPLSEHEQRLLDQIERALIAEDPKFASTVRAGSVSASASRSALTHPAALGRCPGVGVRPYEGQAPSALPGFVRHGTVSEARARPGLETRVPCLRLTARAGEDTPLLKSVNSGQEIATQALR